MEIKQFPHIVVKDSKGYRIYPILNRYVEYRRAFTSNWRSLDGRKRKTRHPNSIRILYRDFREGEVKVIKPKLWGRIKEIDDQIETLRTKKRNLLKANFSRLPNLTIPRIREINNLRREILFKLGLIKEK